MKVLALVEAMNEVSCRYRIEAFRDALAKEDLTLEIVPLRKNIWGRLCDLRRAKGADIVILQRKLLPLWEISLLRNWSNRLIFDVDDAIFQRGGANRNRPLSWSRLARFRGMAYESDTIFVGNEYLRLVALKWALPEQVAVVPTCVELKRYPEIQHHRKGPDTRLVWMGNVNFRQTAIESEEILQAIDRRLPGIRFHQYGGEPFSVPGWQVEGCSEKTKSETIDLSEGDIGLAYLPDDSWSLGDCGLQVLHYMAAGMPVVANPVGVHREMIVHGENGFLADSPNDWAEAVFQLADRPELRAKLGAAGRKMVEAHYSTTQWGPPFAQLVLGSSEEPELKKAS